jgi:hypothetical protein
MTSFHTQIVDQDGTHSGPFKSPKQMLHDQVVSSAGSIHDDGTAQTLGFRGGTIEGPTHFSQFEPLAERLWGDRWFESGCISSHFRAPAFAGERLKAFLRQDPTSPDTATIWLEREDGIEILRGSASVGAAGDASALRRRLAGLSPLATPVIHADLLVGTTSGRQPVRIDADERIGDLYPFSLNEKLAAITERCALHENGENKWGAPVLPLEMVSVLFESAPRTSNLRKREPVVALYADLEVRLLQGPVLAGHDYEVDREIRLVSGSRRTESMWVLSRLWRAGTDRLVAEMLHNEAAFKASYEPYAAEYQQLYGVEPPPFE